MIVKGLGCTSNQDENVGHATLIRRIHIVGAHRSGTSLMLDLVASCFANVAANLDAEMSIYDEPDPRQLDAGTEVFVSKQPRDVTIIGPVLKIDRALHVICMIRDPRAVITSVNRTHPDKYFCNGRVWLECDAAARKLESHPRFLVVRYEDLVKDPDAVQQQLMQRIPFLKFAHRFSEFHKFSKASVAFTDAMNGLRPIAGDRVDAWKNHLPRIKAELASYPELRHCLIARGYEPDESWTTMLEAVEPQHTSSRAKEEFDVWHRIAWGSRNWLRYQRKRIRLWHASQPREV